jgi:hypothetical protein
MNPRFLLDENLRGPLWDAIQRHNEHRSTFIDVARVGDDAGPSLGAKDAELLVWCEAVGRILVSGDKRTLPGHLVNHLGVSRHSPGVFLVRPGRSIRSVVEFLALAACSSDAAEWRDTLTYIP